MLGNSKERIGQDLRERRKAMGLSLHDLAEKSGVSYGALQAIESGKSNPQIDTLEAICMVLGLTPSDIWHKQQSGVSLSPTAIHGPLSAADGALILARLASATPAQRAMALTILFEEPEFLKDFELPKELVPSILGSVKSK